MEATVEATVAVKAATFPSHYLERETERACKETPVSRRTAVADVPSVTSWYQT